MRKGFSDEGWTIEDWVILDNHYHLMVNSSENPNQLGSIIKEIHRFNSLWIRKNVPETDNEEIILYNCWDTCITYVKSYYSRLNYIWYNPVKHGYVKNPEDWVHGSCYYRIKNEEEYLKRIFMKYPFDKLDIKDDF